MPRPSHSSRFYHPNHFGWGVQIIKLLIMQFSLLPCHLVPLRPKFSPLHLSLKHPQPTFLPQFERQSSTPMQNNRQNYNYVHTSSTEFYLKQSRSVDIRYRDLFRPVSTAWHVLYRFAWNT
jgi:hypothetical protein